MKQLSLTAEQSKAARSALRVSQSAVARATGINRSQLALFEVRKYLLPQDKLETLRQYYEDSGYQLSNGDRPAPLGSAPDSDSPEQDNGPDFATVDGFVVPSGLDQDDLEARLQEIADNDQKIEALSQGPVTFDWWTGSPVKSERDEIVHLMARNYLLIRALQGREPPHAEEDGTVGALLQSLVKPAPNTPTKRKSLLDELFS